MYVEQDPPEEAMLSADGALTGDKKKEDRLGEEDDRLEESEAIFFHGSPAEAPVACERLHIVKEHSGFLVNAHWSPDGALLATSDSGVLIVWLFDPLGLEICSRLYSVTATSEVFDFCWLDSAILVLGGITKIIFSHRGTTIFELDLPDGAFCKGLKAQRSDQNYSDHSDQSHSDQASDQRGYKSYLLCVATSTKQHLFYRVLLSEGFDDPHTALSLQTELLWEVEEKLFEGGDVPLLRSPSIDPTGQLVCLPYGERRRQFFAVCCDLRSRRNFRLRGHQARISCAALANTWHQFPIPPSAFIPLNEALVNVLDDDKITNDGQSFSFTLLVHYSTLACPLLHPCFSTPPCF
ncbi:hypothetical protein GNI_053270 [Gregarina niphandrodes]|uniref:WD domain, G-beta repeat protein n=1 Tax=Gregarina niphandrodes TaxID=110365 RepID=A0A023B945_GRENI|nr:hypothetical protein GNI_053270 [Gregarina niphandrodes]EZG71255.1 hypothetical protein GNI_053270 [Gregarina niphandrodes]|eukprot:XP_011129838.1 hypothetical protein GNI_053270 [Gregarina niphandrodes]